MYQNQGFMLKLELPVFDCKIKQKDGKLYIYDVLRKKYVVLQPEEWVRQHVINFLLTERNVSPVHIKVETGRKYSELQKRCDILVWDADMNPLLLVECKAPHIAIDHKAVFQIGIYNASFKSKYLWLTNGIRHEYFQREGEGYVAIEQLPELM